MAKQTVRMRCNAINEYEREAIPTDANAPPLRVVLRRINLIGEGANFMQLEFHPEHARAFEIGGEYDVTVATVPKVRAPRR